MALWLARSGKYGENEEVFLNNNHIYMSWDGLQDTDLSSATKLEDIRIILEETYPNESKGRITNWSGQISVHRLYMSKDDWVVMPLKKKPAIAVGQITSDYIFDAKSKEPYNHFRNVKWLDKAIPRSRFDQDLLYSFGAFMTFCKIERNNAEERVKAIVHNKQSPIFNIANDVPDDVGIQANIGELAQDQLAQFIISRFKGDKLELLVEAILKAQGYTTYRSPTGPDKGVDILASLGPLGFGSPRICVQVKSSESPLDRPTLDQLVGTMQRVKADQGLLVSWGGFKDSVEKERANHFFTVRFWNQSDLIDQLQIHYENLDDTIKADLPLKRIWVVTEGE